MTEITSKTFTKERAPEIERVFGDLGKHWGWLLALGMLFIVLGTIALGMSVTLTVVTVLFFGVLLSIGGIFQIVEAFKCKGWRSVLLHILIALLYITAGVMLITEPIAGSLALTALLGGAFVATGVLRIVMGFHLKGTGVRWGWVVFAGVVSLVLGGMILFQWPVSALWVIGLLVAIEMLFHGWSYVMIALAAKSIR
ncbi:conserved hypothetical protein [Nitrosococcus oceani ATCC 19707]|uniref:HdeD protein n=2 Tax=Nitrosococcus oceani TaxID=1229 RepID=Q3JBG4_NITOC|nr:HdeD family acid-resistance protein [Nitrosococcus oceani]ABA57832.1 conserved hypothetical protein [Nitrosococcus oceani ATCC 19707]EDZ67797.1 hypothetical protein NOC27_1124 [Nitrosococcus oceani AFC27]KFI19712.1 membrane protein [Nitrosococcus oceani C-27]GEM19468.1 membrane protein [Nitrosococcus oceani]